MVVPEVVTHYHLASRLPFLSLSDLDDVAVHEVMRDLNALRRAGRHRRQFGATYIAWRRLTEASLREQFVARGGRPERVTPHYFCLGESHWFEGLADDMRCVTLALADLPVDQVSVTLVDSFTAMGHGPTFGFPAAAEAHQSRLYLLPELEHVLVEHGLPADARLGYDGFDREVVDQFVEVQLWSDEPVRAHLA